MALPTSLYFFSTFFNSQGQILSWCLQFTTVVYHASCCCYLGKLQSVQKALSFLGTVNSHLGVRLFFFFFCESGLASQYGPQVHTVWCKARELGIVMCQGLTQVWYKWCQHNADAWVLLHDAPSLRAGGVSHVNDFCLSAPLFFVLYTQFSFKVSFAFSPRSWRVTSLPRNVFSAQVLWTPKHQRKLHLSPCRGRSGSSDKYQTNQPYLACGSPGARIWTCTWVTEVSQWRYVG